MSTIKALSLWQPWASLWLSPAKRHETRDWATKHRGKLLVHAAKRFVRDVEFDLDRILVAQFGKTWRQDLPAGALLGVIDLEDCLPCEKIATDRDDLVCGNFDEGRFGLRRGPTFVRFRHPVPYRGRQTLFDVSESAIAEAMNAVVKWETEA